jgi:predicted MFS family arabinose efflux permease
MSSSHVSDRPSSTTASDWLVMILMSGTFFSIVIMNYILAPILPQLAAHFAISIEQAGLLVSAYGILFACAALMLGSLGDRFGPKRTICIALTLFGVGTVSMGFAPSFPLLIVARALSGLAAAVAMPATWALVANTIPYERRGRATGFVMQAGTVALLAGVPLGGLIAEYLGWRAIFEIFGVMAIVIMLIVALQLPADPPRTQSTEKLKTFEIIRGILAKRPAQITYLISFLQWMAMFGCYTYVGSYLQHDFGLGPAQVGQATLALGIGYAIGGQVGGRMVDTIGPRKVSGIGMLLMGLVTITMPYLPNVALISLWLAFLGFSFYFGYAAQVSTVSEIAAHARSTGMSINYFCTYSGSATGARLGGLAIASFGFVGVGVVSGLAAFFGVLLLLLSKPIKKVDTTST